jgi:hypothetical protein
MLITVSALIISKGEATMEPLRGKVSRGEATEDQFTGAIEKKTARLPSSAFLGLALGSMAVSAALKIAGKNDWSFFVGQWAAPFLILGSYNKMVKQHGSDAQSRPVAA